MKKIHLKFSLLFGGLIVIAVLSAKIKFETRQAVQENAEQYFKQKTDQEGKPYRYYLQIFKLFNAR